MQGVRGRIHIYFQRRLPALPRRLLRAARERVRKPMPTQLLSQHAIDMRRLPLEFHHRRERRLCVGLMWQLTRLAAGAAAAAS